MPSWKTRAPTELQHEGIIRRDKIRRGGEQDLWQAAERDLERTKEIVKIQLGGYWVLTGIHGHDTVEHKGKDDI